MSHRVATVEVEFITIPERTKYRQAITIDSGVVSTSTIVKALTGLDILCCDIHGTDQWVTSVQEGQEHYLPMTLAITRLRITGSSVAIGTADDVDTLIDGTLRDDTLGYNTMLEEVIIEADKCKIGAEAFSYCRSLNSVILPDSISSIGAGPLRAAPL